MERISKSELTAIRIKKAAAALRTFSLEIEELRKRLSLVEIHNEELQDLVDRIGESSAVLAASIESSMEGLNENMDFVANEDENKEIAEAEEFSSSGNNDVDFDF